MSTPTLTSNQLSDDRLALHRLGRQYEIELSSLQEIWIVRIGDDFAGPNEHVAMLVSDSTFTPVALNHHSFWNDLKRHLQRLAMQGRVFQAEAASLPVQWTSTGFLRLPSGDVIPDSRPRSEFDLASKQWISQPLIDIPETMP